MKIGIKNEHQHTWPTQVKSVHQILIQQDIKIKSLDLERPWGGFFVIDEKDTKKFLQQYFSEMEPTLKNQINSLQPKILCVAPNHQLSWQYHDRRSELWKLVKGKCALKRSNDDVEGAIELMNLNEIVHLKEKERHRLIGLNEWGIIAEIWIHVNRDWPSDERDIHRIHDLYGR